MYFQYQGITLRLGCKDAKDGVCLQDLLAEAGMLGRVLPFGQEETSFGIWPVSPAITHLTVCGRSQRRTRHIMALCGVVQHGLEQAPELLQVSGTF